MSFTEAVSSVYRNYAKFDGRASRAEYWWFTLFAFLVIFGLAFAAGMVAGITRVSTSSASTLVVIGLVIFGIVSFIPSIAVGVRRLHDSEKSGWWYLLVLIPYLGGLILLILLALPGSPGYNRYGPPPGRSSAAQRAQYWGPGRPEALRKFAEDAQRAAASGYHPVWQEWKQGPTGELLEVTYDLAPTGYGWGQPGYWPAGGGPYAAPGPYGANPTAYPPGGTWYQGVTPYQPRETSEPRAAGGGEASADQRPGTPGGPPQPPSWS